MNLYKRICAYILAIIMILGNVLSTGIVAEAADYNMELSVGESRYITDYQWVNDGIKSSNPEVATAVKDNSNNGQVKITGHAKGTAVIRFSHWTGEHTVTVTVTRVDVKGISLSPETINLAVGHRAKAIATFSPSNATNQNLTWTSSDESVASVDSQTGVIIGVSKGDATITAKTVDGGHTAKVTVKVDDPTTTWIKDTSHTFVDGNKYVFISNGYQFYNDGGSISAESVQVFADGMIAEVSNQLTAWTYSEASNTFGSFDGTTMNTLTGLNDLEYITAGGTLLFKGTCAPVNNPGWTNAPHYIALENEQFVKKLDTNGYSEHSYPQSYQFTVYKEVPINSSLGAEFYIVNNVDDIAKGVMTTVGTAQKTLPTAVGLAYDTEWYENATWSEGTDAEKKANLAELGIAAVSVNGKLYSGPQLNGLQIYPGLDGNVKYYFYQSETVKVKAEFYFVDSVGVIHDEHYCNSSGDHHKTTKENVILNRKNAINLLENPLEIFGVTEEDSIYEELQKNNATDLLYEVRSSKEIKSSDGKHVRQWIYASVRSNANNYIPADTHLHVDTEHPPIDLDDENVSLKVNELDGEYIIKYIFHKKLSVPIEYYYEAAGETTTLLATSYTSKENWSHICPPAFNASEITVGNGEKEFVLKYGNTWPLQVERTSLVNRRMEFYVNDILVKTVQGVSDRVELTDDEADIFVGNVKVKIYYTKPATVELKYYHLSLDATGAEQKAILISRDVKSDINNTITIPSLDSFDVITTNKFSEYRVELCDQNGTVLREIKGVPEQLRITESGDNFILNIYYVRPAQVTVEYYFLALNNDGKEQIQKLGNVIKTVSADENYKVSIPDFTVSDAYLDLSKIHVESPWPSDIERTDLVGKYVRQYDAKGTLIQSVEGVPDEFQLQGIGDNFKLKVYFVKKPTATGNILQLPVTIRDFRGDGTLFEYDWDVADPSRKYNLYDVEGAEHPNGDGSERTTGLIESQLKDGKIVYKEATVRYVAQLLYAGIYNDNNFDRYTNIIGHIFDVIENGKEHSEIDAMGSMDTVKAALATDNEVTYEEIKDAYTAAYYMLSHMWDDDGVAADNNLEHEHAYKEYNMIVPEVRAIQFQEYTDGVERYYEFNSNLYETVLDKENGIIKNTANQPPKTPFSDLYFHPIDGLGYGNVAQDETPVTSGADQLDQYNYLFTTVGEGQFVYSSAKNLYFEFNGDDDVYLFIDGKLVVDNGGAHQIENASVRLNDINGTILHLEEGNSYDFTFFHAERRSTGSNFQIRTNIEVMDSAVLTEKHVFQDKVDQIDGNVVDKDQPVVYGFEMINHGKNHVFHLAFEDESLGIRLYSKGSVKACKLDGIADKESVDGGYATEVGQKLSNQILPGNIEITITELDKNGELFYPNVVRYQFNKGVITDPILGDWWPAHDGTALVPDNNSSPTGMTDYGQFKETKLKDKYYEIYGKEGTQEQYVQLLQEILLNGLEPTQRILIKRFNRTMGANETYTNRVNTFATNISNQKIVGTASITVRTLNIENRIFVIDYGKKVYFHEDKIFTDAEKQNTWLKLDVSTTGTPDWKLISETPVAVGKFGRATLGEETNKTIYFQYELDRYMSASEAFKIGIENRVDESEPGRYETRVKTVTMMPASNIYYEDNFNAKTVDEKPSVTKDTQVIDQSGIVFFGNWEMINESDKPQGSIDEQEGLATAVDHQYGFDPNYDKANGFSNGTAWKATAPAGVIPRAYFEFVGNGFDIYTRTDSTTGEMRVKLYQKQIDGSWKFIKMETVDTLYKTGTLYQVPITSFHKNNIDSMRYGTYRVELAVANLGEREVFYLDGIRIYNPAGTSVETETEYAKINEANANYTEIRDILISERDTDGNLYGDGAVYIDSLMTESEFKQAQNASQKNGEITSIVDTYKAYGPKNEVYLKYEVAQGEPATEETATTETVTTETKMDGIAFSLKYKQGMSLQIGARVAEAIQDVTETSELTVIVANGIDASEAEGTRLEKKIPISSTSDMYYRIEMPKAVKEGDTLTVTVLNSSETENNFIALTKLKQSFGSTIHTASSYMVSEETVEVATASIRTFMFRRINVTEPEEDNITQDEVPQVQESQSATTQTPQSTTEQAPQSATTQEPQSKTAQASQNVSEQANATETLGENVVKEESFEEVSEEESAEESTEQKSTKRSIWQIILDFIQKILSRILSWLGL